MINKCHTRYCSVSHKSSRREVFRRKGVLRNCSLSKKGSGTVNFEKFLSTHFFTEYLWWLLLLLDEIQNTKKTKTRESKQRKFEKK